MCIRDRIYSDASVSDFFKSITKDKSTGFLNEWNAKRNRRERIYISYDSTNKNCQAGEIELAEFGHAKTDIGSAIINLSLIHILSNGGTGDQHIALGSTTIFLEHCIHKNQDQAVCGQDQKRRKSQGKDFCYDF